MKSSSFILIILIVFFLISCTGKDTPWNGFNSSGSEDFNDYQDTLQISITFFEDISSSTIYGEPPQLAVWLVEESLNVPQTIFVTRRTALNKWIGKLYCNVSLPYWEVNTGMRNKSRSFRKEKLDGVTSATPLTNQFIIHSIIDTGKYLNYFIEVNLSGDYNEKFPLYPLDVHIDSEGNGQPSLIYSGQIISRKGNSSTPKLVGRTFQTRVEDTLSTDLRGITTAKDIIKSVIVKVL